MEGLADNRIQQMLDAGLIADFGDLFFLTREQLLGLERMGEVSTGNLLTAIDRARTRPLSRVFCALGVRGTGRSMSRRIARHFGSMEAIRAADAEEFQKVDGIGPEKAPVIVAELAELSDLVDKLVRAGVNMVEPGVAAVAGDEGGTTTPAPGGDEPGALPLTGMTVVVTGAMSGRLAALSRNQMNELIEQAGGRASSSVSVKTSLVVAGENAGSKRAKAESLGVRIVSPEEFAEMVAQLLPGRR
ncbi:helix-hairpin-helix domain-containing protein [Microbispora sp. GKU 823]|uniref:helix-hairpin-helix domain-containing protein n=1 Tax=Microbispora sp. GKU 823 TaxID=1652100 RepID=UPI0021195040|nr:helix-hairpin-helix domain-containing protein [Microbispora sp. GKU 823]